MIKQILAGVCALALCGTVAAQTISGGLPGTNTGTVTSVGPGTLGGFATPGGNVSTSGSLSWTWNSQSANNIFAAPSGSAGAPTFRALTALDMAPLLAATNTWTAANAFSPAAGSSTVYINSVASQFDVLQYQSAGLNRWAVFKDNVAEGGSNAGSNFGISRYTDAGTSIDTVFSIARQTGMATFIDGLTSTGSTGSIVFPNNGTAQQFTFGGANTIGTITAAGTLTFQTAASVNALNLDASQKATFYGALKLNTPGELLNAGPTTATAAVSQAIDWNWGTSGDQTDAVNQASIWTGAMYSAYAANKSFNASFNGTNNVTHFLMAEANGTTAGVLPLMTVAKALANNSTVYGANLIATSASALTGVKYVGLEVDAEPPAAITPAAGSAGIYVNAFNVAIPGPGLQFGGVSSGTFNNGIILGGIASTGAGIAGGSGQTMSSLINASAAAYNTTAIILGTGISQGVEFGTGGGGTSPFLYGDASNNATLQLGSSGGFLILNSAGTATMVNIGKQFTVAGLPSCVAGNKGAIYEVSDASAPTYNATLVGGGSVPALAICNGTNWTAH